MGWKRQGRSVLILSGYGAEVFNEAMVVRDPRRKKRGDIMETTTIAPHTKVRAPHVGTTGYN